MINVGGSNVDLESLEETCNLFEEFLDVGEDLGIFLRRCDQEADCVETQLAWTEDLHYCQTYTSPFAHLTYNTGALRRYFTQ